jgi:glycosyltransferase involved in cell wall biosynthesis
VSPRVSVIVPVFNGEAFLREAVESALAQSHRPLEIVVCDDGSTDATPEIARSLPVVYLRQENAGVSAARNAAIAQATGDHLALLDADDIWFPDKLATQLDALGGDTSAFSVCLFRFLLPPDRPLPPWFRRVDPQAPEVGFFAPSCWLVPRPAWERVGPFRPELRTAEDLDWFARAGDAGIRRVVVSRTLLLRRVHDHNLTGQVPSPEQAWLDTLRASVARKQGRA